MAVCLFKQALGTNPKKTQKNPITRVRRGNVLTLLHKQEMDFQDLSLSYTRGTDQINGVKRRRTIFFFFKFSVLTTLILSNTNSGINLQLTNSTRNRLTWKKQHVDTATLKIKIKKLRGKQQY